MTPTRNAPNKNEIRWQQIGVTKKAECHSKQNSGMDLKVCAWLFDNFVTSLELKMNLAGMRCGHLMPTMTHAPPGKEFFKQAHPLQPHEPHGVLTQHRSKTEHSVLFLNQDRVLTDAVLQPCPFSCVQDCLHSP